MLNELKAIAVFAKVAETGSFRGAAKQLGLSPSVVSGHISALEGRIGKPLMYRSTRKLSLTDAGENLWEYARQIVECTEEGLNAVTGTMSRPTGKLRISVPSDYQFGRFVDEIAAFSIIYPEIAIAIDFTDRRCDLVAEAVDLAVRLDIVEDSALMSTKIHEGSRRLFASKRYLESAPSIARPLDLSQHHLIYSAGLRGGITLTHGETGEAQVIRIPSKITASTGYSALRFVEADRGMACLPSFVAANMAQNKGIVEVLPEWNLRRYGVYLVWPANAGSRSISRLLIDFIKERLRQRPPDHDEVLARRFNM